MDIGIIGAGAAGLTAAWLLNDNHNVTLFEKQNRLGGHAHTVDIEIDGEMIAIDAGFDFFSQAMWPTFHRLLSVLGVPLHKYPVTATLLTTHNRRVYPMPFIRDGKVRWSIFRPARLSTMLQFQRALQCARPLIAAADTSITVEQFVEGLKLGRSFKDEFFYPLLLAAWCVEMDEFKQFAAYDALKYAVLREKGRFSTFYLTEVIGGTRVYINALAQGMTRARIINSADIKSVARPSGRYLVDDASGAVYEFDHLIIATNAREACELIGRLDGTEALRSELSKIEYFKGVIAIHGDRRLMPASEKDWSVLNVRSDGARSSLSVWKKWKSRTPVFKSWITYEPQPPEPLYFSTTYDHPKISLRYFEAQRSLAALQGNNNLWLAGLYTHDIDSHESAILSAVKVAERLDPRSPRLKRLIESRSF
jgi:predicted NAD/FAD-binding protein